MAFNHGVRILNGTVTDGANNHIWSWSTVGSISYLSGLGLCFKGAGIRFHPNLGGSENGCMVGEAGFTEFLGREHTQRPVI
jgi:hypothetical protein